MKATGAIASSSLQTILVRCTGWEGGCSVGSSSHKDVGAVCRRRSKREQYGVFSLLKLSTHLEYGVGGRTVSAHQEIEHIVSDPLEDVPHLVGL